MTLLKIHLSYLACLYHHHLKKYPIDIPRAITIICKRVQCCGMDISQALYSMASKINPHYRTAISKLIDNYQSYSHHMCLIIDLMAVKDEKLHCEARQQCWTRKV